MGAWGHGPFDNDSAQDWLGELTAAGPSRVGSAVQAIASSAPGATLSVDTCSIALAAAELVAAARDGRTAWLDDASAGWIATHRDALLALDVARIRDAVERIASDSDLRELWSDAGKRGEAFHAYVRELVQRLSR